MSKEKIVTNIAIIYFILGLIFAILYAIYYHWEVLSFLSPGFYAVVLSWPFQTPGFISDLTYYGLTGKPI